MRMRMGMPYTMVNTVIAHEADRLIAWQTRPKNPLMGRLLGGRIWRYEFEPSDGGTLVRETWDISEEKHRRMVEPIRSQTIENMTKTLERLEQAVTT